MMVRLSYVIPLVPCAAALSSSHITPGTKRVAIIGT